MTRPVLTKKDFVRRYKEGEFGNAAPTWNTLRDWACTRTRIGQLYHIRSKIAGGRTRYNLRADQLVFEWSTLQDHSSYYISAMAPHDRGAIQGEIRRTFRGLELYWTWAELPMREAFERYGGITSLGLGAKLLLQGTMDTASYEWLEYLLEAYDDHVIEFSTFDVNWGTIPNRNTVIWEVRPDRGLGSNLSEFTEVY